MIRIILVGIFVGVPLVALLGTMVYAYYVCMKYIKEHKR